MYKVILLFMVLVFSSTLWAAPKRLALITPRSAHDAFWGPFQLFSEAAAKHFGYQLDTYFAENDHLQMTQLVEAAMIKKYDGIILSNFQAIRRPKIPRFSAIPSSSNYLACTAFSRSSLSFSHFLKI